MRERRYNSAASRDWEEPPLIHWSASFISYLWPKMRHRCDYPRVTGCVQSLSYGYNPSRVSLEDLRLIHTSLNRGFIIRMIRFCALLNLWQSDTLLLAIYFVRLWWVKLMHVFNTVCRVLPKLTIFADCTRSVSCCTFRVERDSARFRVP